MQIFFQNATFFIFILLKYLGLDNAVLEQINENEVEINKPDLELPYKHLVDFYDDE